MTAAELIAFLQSVPDQNAQIVIQLPEKAALLNHAGFLSSSEVFAICGRNHLELPSKVVFLSSFSQPPPLP